MGRLLINTEEIQNRIYTIRDMQVMLDSDLADLYGVETKYLNRAVKRNIERFPKSFRFQITEEEYLSLRFQSDTSSIQHGGRRYLPYLYTELGVAMLSAVLHSETAIKVSIHIMEVFVTMKKFLATNAAIFQRLENVELKQLKTDTKIDKIFNALEDRSIKPKQGIFFDGQIFDAHNFVSDLIRNAEKSIILIDNYIDDTILTLFTKRKKNVIVTIYTKKIDKQLNLDLKKYNEQYPPLYIKKFINSHDRFLILDEKTVYHFGASLKDLGKKWFAFSKFDSEALNVLQKLKK